MVIPNTLRVAISPTKTLTVLMNITIYMFIVNLTKPSKFVFNPIPAGVLENQQSPA